MTQWNTLSKSKKISILKEVGLSLALAQLKWSSLSKTERKKIESILKGKGWYEAQKPIVTKKGIEKKAPVHREVAIKKLYIETQREPIKTEKEELEITLKTKEWLDAWVYAPKELPKLTSEIEQELSRYKPAKSVVLYRSQKIGDKLDRHTSWTYMKEMAQAMSGEGEYGKEVISRTIHPNDILVDFTKLPSKIRDEYLNEVIVKPIEEPGILIYEKDQIKEKPEIVLTTKKKPGYLGLLSRFFYPKGSEDSLGYYIIKQDRFTEKLTIDFNGFNIREIDPESEGLIIFERDIELGWSELKTKLDQWLSPHTEYVLGFLQKDYEEVKPKTHLPTLDDARKVFDELTKGLEDNVFTMWRLSTSENEAIAKDLLHTFHGKLLFDEKDLAPLIKTLAKEQYEKLKTSKEIPTIPEGIDLSNLIVDTTEGTRLKLVSGPFKGKSTFRCPECGRGLVVSSGKLVCGEHGTTPLDEAMDLRKISTDKKTTKWAKEYYEYWLSEAKEEGFDSVVKYVESMPGTDPESYKAYAKWAIGLEEIFGMHKLT